MEFEPVFATRILEQLRERNAAELAFTGVFQDYQTLLQRNRELQVRNAQLDKEAGELRAENIKLSEHANRSQVAAANNAEILDLRAKCTQLQEDVNKLYAEKAKLAGDLLSESKKLQIVRDNFEQHDKSLTERSNQIKDLKAFKKDLQEQLERLKSAQAESARELEAHLAEKEAAQKRVQELELDNNDITKRLVELKSTEIDRMNEVNRICDEMMKNARNIERAAAAEANSGSRQVLGKLFGSGKVSREPSLLSGSLVDQLKDVTMRASLTESRIPSGKPKTSFVHEGGCYALTFDRSGARLASAGGDKVVRLWEASSGTQTGQLHGMQDMVTDLAYTCDQNHLLAAGTDKTVRMWSLSTQRVRHTLTGHTDKVSSVSCSPVDEKLAASGSSDRSIKTWDLHRGFVQGSFIHASRCHSVRWTLDGTMLASGHLNGSLCFWDRRTHKSVHEVAGLHTQQIVSVAIGGRTGLILTCGKDHLLKLVDMRTFQVRQEMRANGFMVGNVWCSASIASDEKHVAAGSTDGTVFIWDAEVGNLKKTLPGSRGSAGILACSWSPQGSPLVTSDRVGAVSFWDGGS